MKKDGKAVPEIALEETPDILKTLSNLKKNRPKLVIGFAAETDNLQAHATAKLKKKGCDWILANAVGPDKTGAEKTFGAEENQIYFVSPQGIEEWPRAGKLETARMLVQKIMKRMGQK